MNKVWWKKIHNVLGLASAVFLLLLLVTGVLLNHPGWVKDRQITALALDPTNSMKILRGDKDGISLSLDGGKTWEEIPMLYPAENIADIRISEDGKSLYILEKWGRLISSQDGGRVWQSVGLPFDAQSEGIELKSLSLGKAGSLALLTSHGWLASSDQGTTWDTSGFDKTARPVHRLILTIHNGYFFGPKFFWLYDFSSIALLILIVSGIILWRQGRSNI